MTNRPGRPRKSGRKNWPRNLYKNASGTFWFRNPKTGDVLSLGMSESQAMNAVFRLNRAMGDDSDPVSLRDEPEDAHGLLSAAQICERAESISTSCGIYFLLSAGKIVYVGQSINCGRRILEHVIDPSKTFDAYHVIACDRSALNEMEARYIAKFSPALNINMPRRAMLQLDAN
jgi:hypothetical protein